MKKIYISLRLHKEPATRPKIDFILPKGCVGIMFAFSNKKDGKEFSGNDIEFVEAEAVGRKDV